MFIYKNKQTQQVVKREKRDKEKEESDEWEMVAEYKNGQYKDIVTK